MMRLVPPRPRRRRILELGLPIGGGMVSGTLLELVDLAFVGSLGTHALAAVGLGGFVAFIYVSLFFGLGNAVIATASRQVGAGRPEGAGAYLNAALVLTLLGGVATAAPLVLASPWLFGLMNDDPEVLAAGIPYLQWLFATSPVWGASIVFGQTWNAVGRPRFFMLVAILQNLLNIPFNYVFIFGLGDWVPAFGVTGAGIGTFAASLVGLLAQLVLAAGYGAGFGFLRARPKAFQALELLRLGIPSGAREMLGSVALAINYRIVGLVGTPELAVYAILMNFISFVGLPAFALGTAGATLVGQSLGAGDPDEAHRWGLDTVKVGALVMLVLGIPLWAVPREVIEIFVREPETIALAIAPVRILGIMIGLNGVSYMMSAILSGAGDVRRVLWVNLATNYGILIPLGYVAGLVLGFGLIGMWVVHQFLFRAVEAGIYLKLWHGRRWVNAFRLREQDTPVEAGDVSVAVKKPA
jgi:putative MATE family efflux protein